VADGDDGFQIDGAGLLSDLLQQLATFGELRSSAQRSCDVADLIRNGSELSPLQWTKRSSLPY